MSHRLEPSLELEARLWADGYRRVAGLDEVGRGAWAGPVVAAAVVLPHDDPELFRRLAGVCDSKQLSPAQREFLVPRIQACALAWGVGEVPPAEIDVAGIVACTRLAMLLALHAIRPEADALLIDYLSLPGAAVRQVSLPKGDAHVLSIAAASILAKVHRDQLMAALESQFPGYGLARHKGYGTPKHRAALESMGPSAIHRLSFAPMRGWGGP